MVVPPVVCVVDLEGCVNDSVPHRHKTGAQELRTHESRQEYSEDRYQIFQLRPDLSVGRCGQPAWGRQALEGGQMYLCLGAIVPDHHVHLIGPPVASMANPELVLEIDHAASCSRFCLPPHSYPDSPGMRKRDVTSFALREGAPYTRESGKVDE